VAISYLGREDLAHAQPSDMLPDSLGTGAGEGDLPTQPANTIAALQRLASNGYVRSPSLFVISGGGGAKESAQAIAPNVATSSSESQVVAASTVTAESVTVEASVYAASQPTLERIREAQAQGYEGDACSECGNFTLVRNGTCMKCVTCGATSGCS
jgi:ribonucleoside-diphosphate reductase alpha chain